jgi:hypothetical protein
MADGDSPNPRARPARPDLGQPPTYRQADDRSAERPHPEVCGVCGTRLPPGHLDAHFRHAHQLYAFRGRHRPLQETLHAMLRALRRPASAAEAWAALTAVARDTYGPGADVFLAASASQALARARPERREAALAATARAIAAREGGPRLLAVLAADPEPTARQLALELAAALPPPLPADLLAAVGPLLADRRATPSAVAAAAALLGTTGREGPPALEVFQSLVRGVSTHRSVERLKLLSDRVGPCPDLEAFLRQTEDQLRMTCPRCSVELRRREMVPHLWQEHQLVLDGRRVRDPWQMVEEWLTEMLPGRPPGDAAALLDHCRTLGQRLDPENGLTRVHRLFMAHGVDDEEARRSLLAEAAARRASLCPDCFALVPVPPEAPRLPLNVWRGRLSLRGYRVEVADDGLFTDLEIETAAGVERRLEPGRWLTRRGAAVLLAGPPVVLALLAAVSLEASAWLPLLPVTVLLAVAGVVGWLGDRRWRPRASATDRAVDHAWTLVAPRLHAEGFVPADGVFAAGLALTSLNYGRASVRAEQLARLLAVTEKAVAAGAEAVERLADLRRLAIHDAAVEGDDPVPLVVAEVARCFDGRLSFAYAERLLEAWESDWWTPASLARLRVLLCDRAFEAGFEVRNLLEAGRAAPTLGAVLEAENRRPLAWLRLLWSLRPRRPWDHCGKAVTVFEVAESPAQSRLLAEHPDLLLLQEGVGGWGPAAESVLVGGGGLVFGNVLFTERPGQVEVVSVPRPSGVTYDLEVAGEVFEFAEDPEDLALRLRRWFRFLFDEFLPKVAEVYRWQSPSVAATLRARESVACPECRHAVLTRPGKIGRSLEEPAEAGERAGE